MLLCPTSFLIVQTFPLFPFFWLYGSCEQPSLVEPWPWSWCARLPQATASASAPPWSFFSRHWGGDPSTLAASSLGSGCLQPCHGSGWASHSCQDNPAVLQWLRPLLRFTTWR